MAVPFEADPQLASLEMSGYTAYTVTEDSDLFPLGSRVLVEPRSSGSYIRGKLLSAVRGAQVDVCMAPILDMLQDREKRTRCCTD